ncbi:MAG: rhomboid family intramembrane serine protease [Deltaproteobacteria bacterium]|nr:MAG: rhomboid family intramembrane serine protease [Deltaproteobacteria bacterium]
MIPIRDTIRSKNYPVVNTVIIVLNVLVFFMQPSGGEGLKSFIFTYGLVPARYTIPAISSYFTSSQQLFSFLSFMFLHGGFFHLLGNMWSLYIFGDNVEDRLGSLRYLLFYLLCGFASGISHLVVNWNSQIPTIGASGAIAGVMGAYLVLFPKSRILTLIPIFFFFQFIEIPAFFFLGIWFIFQFLSAAATAGQGGIAWWAHIGGFIFGIIFLRLFLLFKEPRFGGRLKQITKKGRSDRIQVIRPVSLDQDPDIYGNITITQKEALYGARKLVNIPEGLKKRMFVLLIPPGTSEGSKLRLSGLGGQLKGGDRGDLYLKVKVED